MAENWWDSYKRTDEEENWWESYKRADEPAPSAGGGRGFVNPPRVFEKQPVRSAPSAPVEPTDYGQASTDMMGTPMSQAGPGLIQRVGAALRPAPTPSVMDGFVPPAPSDRERQAEIDRRLSYGAGPISPKVVRSADDLRNARQSGGDIAFRDQAYGATVNRVADAMDRGGQLSSGQVVENTNRKMIRDMVTDDKAAEFRSVGEWAVDSLSTVASGVVTLAQLPVNILSPGSDLADSLRQTQKELEAENSDVYKASRDSLRRRVESEEGFLGKYFSTVAELVSNPTLSVNEALKQIPMFLGVVGGARLVGSVAGTGVAVAGRVAPNVALADAIGGGAITAAARGAGSTVGGLGASMVMAGGDAAGNTYETLTKKTPLSEWQKNPDFQKLVSEGKPEEDAIEEIATAKARMAALITAPLGILGFMGAESAVVGRGVGRFAADALTPKGAAKLVAKENLTEQLEEGGTQAGSNLIASTVKRDQSLMEGVPEAMATAAVTSTPFGVIGAYSQYKAAQDQSVDPFTDYAARANLSTQNPDGTLIAPGQSARRPYDIGPSAPIRSGADGEINFTPQGSITAEAGLAPIVVPMGAGQQTGGVNGGLPDVLGGLAGGSGVAGGGDPLAGLGSPGRDAGLPGRGGANAQGALVGDGGLALPGAGAGQPGPSLAAGRGERATDADLLARAGQASEGAPAKIWAGRAGDGYAQQQDAQQAFPSLQRRYPDLSWSMQQDADGKFYWSGRSTGESNGSVAGAAGQGLAGVPRVGSAGQEADAGAGVVGFGPSRIGQPGQPGGASTVGSASPDGPAFTLNLAPPAPRQTVLRAITSVKSAQGVDIEFEAQSLTDQQKVASAMARLVGKTVTFYTHKAGPAAAVPNGFVLDGNDRDIFLDKSSNDGALFVMMHEGVHALPQPIREKLVETLKGLTKTDMRADFATKFSYDINNEYQIDNEIAAFMTQAVSKRKDFWQELRTKMGDGDFAEVAKVIISKLDTFIRGANQAYGEDFLKRYATDAVAVRDAVSTAYAQAMKAQGQQAPAGAASALTSPAADQVTPSQRLQQPVVFDFSQTLFKPQTDAERRQNFANRFNNPVTLADGTRLSGFTDPARQTTFHGYDKNGEQLTIRAEFVSPEDIVFSKDSNRTAELVRNGLMKLQETAPASKNITPSNRAADVNPLGMYSELARKIDAGPGQAMPDQWRGYIRGLTTKGVKPDEIEWSGVEDFISLKGGKISKQEVADYLKQGGVKVEETVLGNAKGFTQEMQERLDELEEMGDRTDEEDAERQRLISAENAASDERGDTNQTKYSEYTLPGGENYREVLLTLPGKPDVVAGRRAEIAAIPGSQMTPALRAEYESILRESDARKPPKYRSDHWDQPNVLAHIRMNDRTDADGKKVLFVEEIQSDWGQEGKKQGFKGKTQEDAKRFFGIRDEDWAKTSEENRESYRLEMLDYKGRDGVPSAPFVTKTEGWLNLALKRVMTMAAEGGYDRVAFVNGEQSHKRFPKKASGESTKESFKAFYDTIVPTALKKLLPKVGGGQVGGVQFDATGEGRFSVFDEDSGEMVWRGETREDAEEFVSTYGGDASIKEGSKDYDKFGGTQPGFDITPAMREKVATTGLPMFSKRVSTLGAKADAEASFPEEITADGIRFSLRRVEEINDVPEITMQDLIGETVFPILADLTAAGYVYMGKELRGGPYYTLLPSNSKAGLIWANDGDGVAKLKEKKAARGVIGFIVAMKQTSHATNNTVANIVFRAVEDEIKKGSVAPTDIPKLDDIVRDLASRQEKNKKTGEMQFIYPQFAKFPGFSNRAASEKFLRKMTFDGRRLFFDEMTKPTVEDLGLGVIRKVINETIEPDMRGLNKGDVVMAIRFDPDAKTIKLGKKTGTPKHDSYTYGIKGEVIGKFRRPISFQNVFVDLMAERQASGKNNIDADYRSLTLRKPEQLITQEIADRITQTPYQFIGSPAEAQAATAAANIDWTKIDRPTGAGVKEFLRTSRIYGRGDSTPSFTEAKALIKGGKLRIFRLAETENWFSLEDRDGKRVMTSVMVSQPGVRQETLFGDMIEVAKANGATHIEIGKTVASLKKVDAPRRVAPIIGELSAMTDNDLINLGIDPVEVRRLGGMTKSSDAAQSSPTSAVMFSNRVSPADKIKWREISEVKSEIGLDRLPAHIIPFAEFMGTMATKANNGGLTSRDVIKAYTIARSSMNRGAVTTAKVAATGLDLPAEFSDSKIRPEGAFGYWLLSAPGQRYLNAAEVGLVDEESIDNAVKVMAPFGTQNTLGEDLRRAASGDLHTRLPGLTAAIVKASKGENAVEDWQDALSNLYGVREAKKGFLGSLLGFGQLPTFDARQINVNVEGESKEATLRALTSTKAREVVATLARRMDALSLTMDPKYAPFYQHLAHHAVWDAVGGTETTHSDVVESMLQASNRVTEDRAAAPAQPKPATPATIIVGGRTLRIPDPAGAVETLDAKINRYSELLKCLQ